MLHCMPVALLPSPKFARS